MNELISKVQQWSKDKGLATADPSKQLLKVLEELAEVSEAFTRGKWDDLSMEIGDLLVTVIILSQQVGIAPDEALSKAYDKISKRKGEMRNGVFVKEEDLHE